MSRVMNQLSISAYLNTVKPALTKREEWVLSAIEDMGEASAESVANYYGVGINVISGRFTGLKKKEKIVPTKRIKTRSGNMAQYYRAVETVEREDVDSY